MADEKPKFEVIVLGIIFNPSEKKFLITKRGGYSVTQGSGWHFPGGRLIPGEDIDEALKRSLKEKTGYSVKNVGAFFSQTYEENKDVVSVYFLTEVFEGKETPAGDTEELRWVSAKELDELMDIPLHKKLREFIFELV